MINANIGESAAIQLLACSRLRLDAEHYRDPTDGELQWDELRARVAFSSSEKFIIDLAESLAGGVLEAALTGLDERNWRVFIEALEAGRRRR